MNRVGFSATYGFDSIEDVINYSKDKGFDAVEINLNIPEFFPERYSAGDRESLKMLAQDKDIIVTFHAPEDINLCTRQKYLIDASIKRLKECIDFACDLGGRIFTFHIGDSVNFTMYNGNLPLEDYYPEDYVKILESAFSEISSYAGDRIVIDVENNGYFSNVKKKAVQSFLGKGLYLTWDIGHSCIKKNQEEYILNNIDYIRHIHVHDVIGSKDHCIIGTGEADVLHYLGLIDDEKIIHIIEVRPAEAALESYNNLKKLLNERMK